MALAVVRSSVTLNIATAAVATFPTAPAVGNLVLAFFYYGGATPTFTANWTKRTQTSATGAFCANRYVQSGDGATMPAITSTTQTCRVYAMEISGVQGTWAQDFEQSATFHASTPPLTSGITTTHASDLAILAGNNESGGSIYTPQSGWTNDQANTSEAASLDHKIISSSGTALGNVGGSWNSGTNNGEYQLIVLAGPTSTETATGKLGFGPHAFAASGSREETASGALAFGPHAFSGSGTVAKAGTGVLAFGPPAMSGAGFDKFGNILLAFGPPLIVASSLDAVKPFKRHFWTFGA